MGCAWEEATPRQSASNNAPPPSCPRTQGTARLAAGAAGHAAAGWFFYNEIRGLGERGGAGGLPTRGRSQRPPHVGRHHRGAGSPRHMRARPGPRAASRRTPDTCIRTHRLETTSERECSTRRGSARELHQELDRLMEEHRVYMTQIHAIRQPAPYPCCRGNRRALVYSKKHPGIAQPPLPPPPRSAPAREKRDGEGVGRLRGKPRTLPPRSSRAPPRAAARRRSPLGRELPLPLLPPPT